MQGVLTSREAWVRFSCALFVETELSTDQIAKEADQMLIEYLKRFPDPKGQRSARLLKKDSRGEPEGVEFMSKAPAPLTPPEASPSSESGQS
jgi:hypothetical protein